MTAIQIEPLREDLPFGVRISGVTYDALKDEQVRAKIREAFETRGLIHFADVEPSNRMQVALSLVFGPLKDHPVEAVDKIDPETMGGAIKISADPSDADIVEIDGKQMLLSPGAQIRGPENRIILPMALPQNPQLVKYVVDPAGHVHRVWILTREEAAKPDKRP